MLPKSGIGKNLPAHPDRKKDLFGGFTSLLFFHIDNETVTAAALDRDFFLPPLQDLGVHFQMSRTVVAQKIFKRRQQSRLGPFSVIFML